MKKFFFFFLFIFLGGLAGCAKQPPPTNPQPIPKIKEDPCYNYDEKNCPSGCKLKLLGSLDPTTGVEYFANKCVSAE